MSNELKRRQCLKLVALLADLTPPREASPDGTRSDHAVAPNILVRRFLDAEGRRAYRVIARGALVMHLVDNGGAPPSGFSLPGEWADVLAAAASGRAPPGDVAMPSLGPLRRPHSHPSPYGARPSPRARSDEPRFVRSVAEFAASLGTSNFLDLDSITLDIEPLEFRVRLVRLEAKVVVLAYRGGRLRLSALLSRRDPTRPARTILRIGGRWYAKPREDLMQYVPWVDPMDLVRFCQR